jgi:hypothetical protein
MEAPSIAVPSDKRKALTTWVKLTQPIGDFSLNPLQSRPEFIH